MKLQQFLSLWSGQNQVMMCVKVRVVETVEASMYQCSWAGGDDEFMTSCVWSESELSVY